MTKKFKEYDLIVETLSGYILPPSLLLRSTKQQIVHFDRFKPCPSNIRLVQGADGMILRDNQTDSRGADHPAELG